MRLRWRVWYTDGTGIVRMDPMSNPMAACDDGYTRKLSYAFVHGVYWKLLIFPLHLCYDYSMDSIPLITTVRKTPRPRLRVIHGPAWSVCSASAQPRLGGL